MSYPSRVRVVFYNEGLAFKPDNEKEKSLGVQSIAASRFAPDVEDSFHLRHSLFDDADAGGGGHRVDHELKGIDFVLIINQSEMHLIAPCAAKPLRIQSFPFLPAQLPRCKQRMRRKS